MKRIIIWIILGVIVLLVLIQFAPYGKNHTNPAIQQEPTWNSPQTRELAKRRANPLRQSTELSPLDIDDLYLEDEGAGACLVCHK